MAPRIGDKIAIISGPFDGGCADLIEVGQVYRAIINTIKGSCTLTLARHEFTVLLDYVDGATMTKYIRESGMDGQHTRYRHDPNWEYRTEDYNG